MGVSYPTIQAWWAGKPQPSTSGHTFKTVNPATTENLATVETSAPADVDAAVASARAAFPAWSATPPIERSRILHRAAAVLRARNDELALTETHDTGKPISETSVVDVVTGADVLEFFANMIGGGGLNGERVQLRPDAWSVSTKEPLGVCAGIGAWNYPIQIALWKSAPCLAAGNTMVYKPSEVTPLHAPTLAAIYKEAGVPDGVFNVVHGDGKVGAQLSTHPGIAKVSFTGQPSTGQKVAAAAAGGMRYVTMELGGKSACIVLEDAPLEVAVDGAMMANFYSTGQVCTNGTRVFVPRRRLADFEKCLLEKMQHIRPGDPTDPSVNFGPLVSSAHHAKVQAYIKKGAEEDQAKLLTGGPQASVSVPPSVASGYWVAPTVFSPCTDSMTIASEEIFGPVMCILPYDTEDEAVQRANASPLGLAAGVFTRDVDAASRVTQRLEAGIVWVNTWGESPAEMSVGGWKGSGVGVENGRRGLEAWVRNKSTLVDNAGSVATAFAKL